MKYQARKAARGYLIIKSRKPCLADIKRPVGTVVKILSKSVYFELEFWIFMRHKAAFVYAKRGDFALDFDAAKEHGVQYAVVVKASIFKQNVP